MTDAGLRIGSLEVLAALAVFGGIVWRVRPPEPARPMPTALAVDLTVHEAPARGGERTLRVRVANGSAAAIGRSGEAAVWLVDPETSRAHAELSLQRGVLYLADMGSSNGTFLNGKQLSAGAIEVLAGDVIDVGTTRITVNEISPA